MNIVSGPSNDNKLPLLHPLSPCSHLGGARRQDTLSLGDILHTYRLRLQSLQETGTRSRTASASDSIPVAGNDYDEFPGMLFYTVTLDNAALRSGADTPLNRHTVQLPIRAIFMITEQLADLLNIFYSHIVINPFAHFMVLQVPGSGAWVSLGEEDICIMHKLTHL
jgi:hypothetical protein